MIYDFKNQYIIRILAESLFKILINAHSKLRSFKFIVLRKEQSGIIIFCCDFL